MEPLHAPGDAIADRYRILTLLGQGGMGTTYAAEDLATGDRVALKMLSLRQIKEWKVLELFEREAKILKTLSHPYIPTYLDFFYLDTAEDRHFYLVRELIPGESLVDLVQKGWRFEEEQVKQIAQQVLEILNYLHRLNPPLIHRDIKPDNIIYRPDGRVFLVDFGSVQEIYRQTLIGGNTFVGTVGYMFPEQLRGQVSPSSDLYGLGATLLFLLTHHSPDQLPQERMRINFRAQVNLSNHFAGWLAQMVEPAFEDRFASAQKALQALSSSLSQAQPVSPPISLELPPNQNHQFLTYKRLSLLKTPQRLTVKIPALVEVPIARTVAGVILAWLGLRQGGYPIFWITGLLLLKPAITAIACFEAVEINWKTFIYRISFLGFKIRQKTISTAAIDRVELDLSLEDDSSMLYVICTSDEKYPFGLELDRAEKMWLASEISSYLKRQRHL